VARALTGQPDLVFLADGRIVGQVLDPSAEQVLDRMRALGG